MASAKTYNEVDCKEQLLFIEKTKGEYGGYRQDLLANSLSEELIDFYICTKCNGLSRNACIVGADQNLACEMCVLEGETSLPMIKSRKKIPELGAKCPLVSRGCVWKGIIGEVDAHLDECNELIIECLNKCKVILKRSELMNHCENECLNRKVNCMHCKIVFQYKEIDNHLTICPELPLLCINECMETFLLKEMSSHVEKDCPNTLVHCINGCGLKMKRSEIPIHCENECQHRIVSCGYCEVTMLHKELENHYELCLEFPLVCPNECQRILMRKELESHIEEECPNTLIACPYKEMGCDVLTKRCEIQQHEQLSESNHLKITVIYYSGKVKSMETKEKELDLLTSKVGTVEAQMKEKERDNELLTEEVRTLKNWLLTEIKSKLIYKNARFNERPHDEPVLENYKYPEPMQLASKENQNLKLLKPEVLPEKRDEHLMIGFVHSYGLISKSWKRNLVALADGEVHIYNTALNYGTRPTETLKMSRCDSVCIYQNDKSSRKPAVPPNSPTENVFVLRVSSIPNYFAADTMEEAIDWFILLEESKEKHYKEKPVKMASVKSDGLMIPKTKSMQPASERERRRRRILEPELEVLPEKRDEHLKIGFLYRYVAGLLSKGWKRNLVALTDGAVHIYSIARDYGKKPAATIWMSGCDSIETHADDKSSGKHYFVENGFVLRVAGKLHYFIAETMEETMEWLMLLEKSKAKHYQERFVRSVSLEKKPK